MIGNWTIVATALAAVCAGLVASPAFYFTPTVRCVEDQSGANDTEKIQAAIDASAIGDTVKFGTSCTCTDVGSCTPATYNVAEYDTTYENVIGKHGVTYDGQGSTLKLNDKPGGVDWNNWRWTRVLTFGLHGDDDWASGPVAATVIQDLTLDGNAANQGVDAEESKQGNLYLDTTGLSSGKQPVTVTDVTTKDGTWGGLVVRDHVDVTATTITSSGTHHGIQAGGDAFKLTLSSYTSTSDDTCVKVETASTDVEVSISNSTLNAGDDANISWSAGSGSPGFTLDNVTVNAETNQDSPIYINQYDVPVVIKNSDLNGTDTYKTIAINWLGDNFTIQDTTIDGGYVSVGPAQSTYDCSDAVTFDGVTFSGTGGLGGGDYYAIRTGVNLASSPQRHIVLVDTDPGAGNGSHVNTSGGRVTIDQDSIDYANHANEVIRCGASSTYRCEIDWPGASTVCLASCWCGDSVSGTCEW